MYAAHPAMQRLLLALLIASKAAEDANTRTACVNILTTGVTIVLVGEEGAGGRAPLQDASSQCEAVANSVSPCGIEGCSSFVLS